MSNDDATLKLTITLTDRRPVKIVKSEWPILADAEDERYDGQYDFQANRRGKWRLVVRQHADGRSIVYGVHSYVTHYQGEAGRDVRGGELIEATDDLVETIRRVGADLEARLPDDGKYGKGVFPRLVHECIADLPAEDL